jgi:hypothetical protein
LFKHKFFKANIGDDFFNKPGHFLIRNPSPFSQQVTVSFLLVEKSYNLNLQAILHDCTEHYMINYVAKYFFLTKIMWLNINKTIIYIIKYKLRESKSIFHYSINMWLINNCDSEYIFISTCNASTKISLQSFSFWSKYIFFFFIEIFGVNFFYSPAHYIIY